MAAWWLPALKAILPHVGTVISATAPVFTRKTPERDGAPVADAAPAPDPYQLVQQQIAELQAAASRSVDDTKKLAAQLQGTIETLEQAATAADEKLRRAWLVALGAAAAGGLALIVSLFVIFAK